jgi:hypothetical protein
MYFEIRVAAAFTSPMSIILPLKPPFHFQSDTITQPSGLTSLATSRRRRRLVAEHPQHISEFPRLDTTTRRSLTSLPLPICNRKSAEESTTLVSATAESHGNRFALRDIPREDV